MPATAVETLPFVALRRPVRFAIERLDVKRLVDDAMVANERVEVALVVVEFPKMVRLPLIVLEAEEIKPPVSVERLVTARVEERVAAPVTESVLWKMPDPVVVAPPKIVRPVVFVFPPIVEEALTIMPIVEVGAKYAVAPEPFTSHDLPKLVLPAVERQVPFIAKHPPAISMPFANVDVAEPV